MLRTLPALAAALLCALLSHAQPAAALSSLQGAPVKLSSANQLLSLWTSGGAAVTAAEFPEATWGSRKRHWWEDTLDDDTQCEAPFARPARALNSTVHATACACAKSCRCGVSFPHQRVHTDGSQDYAMSVHCVLQQRHHGQPPEHMYALVHFQHHDCSGASAGLQMLAAPGCGVPMLAAARFQAAGGCHKTPASCGTWTCCLKCSQIPRCRLILPGWICTTTLLASCQVRGKACIESAVR